MIRNKLCVSLACADYQQPRSQVRYFEMLMRVISEKLRSPIAAAAMASIALARLHTASAFPPSSAPAAHEARCARTAAEARLRTCRFGLLCSARDWDGAHQAALSDRCHSRALEHIRILIQRVVSEGKLDLLLTWDFPGTSVSFVAELWVTSSRKKFIFIKNKHLLYQSIPKKILFYF